MFGAQAQKAGIKVVASERFLRTDASVTGQVAKLIAAKPDAVLVAAAGGPTVLPQITLVDAGYKGRIYQTHGAATPDFLRLGGAKVEGTVLAASLMLVLPGDARQRARPRPSRSNTSTPTRRCTAASPRPSAPTSTTRDCCSRGRCPRPRSAASPARRNSAPRCATRWSRRKELVGTQGVYNMTPADHSGFDERGRVLITVKDGNWRLLRD